jgi:MYXO-CTERM domain-containing protein
MRSSILSLLLAAVLVVAARPAEAFCGFYVAGADADLFNNATMVVMMREGQRTVLSMQNNYQGPPEDFALVVPVPVVLQKENVKTLSDDVFDRVDKLAAPRLVEYWEQDPCYEPPDYEGDVMMAPTSAEMATGAGPSVTIEAQFKVGEYDVVVLSASDSGGLDSWLRDNHYKIPQGAEPVLRPYVVAGMKFFVAKVDVKKVRFEGGQAKLSPLRFHYDTQNFSLPVRLGLINSAGTQDLIVHILAKERYEVANYPNVTIPTNIDVQDSVRQQFGAFYAALFDATVAKNPGAVVTEYSWASSSCDPCPTPPLGPEDIMALGADVIGEDLAAGLVLTRLHARYDKSALGEDLVFKTAKPIVGGREVMMGNALETGARPDSINNFQGRYAIRHEWTGPIECSDPKRGVWGEPPSGHDSKVMAAQDLAFAPRGGVQLASMVRHPVPEIALEPTDSKQPHAGAPPPVPPGAGGCACTLEKRSSPVGGVLGLVLLVLGLVWRRSESGDPAMTV